MASTLFESDKYQLNRCKSAIDDDLDVRKIMQTKKTSRLEIDPGGDTCTFKVVSCSIKALGLVKSLIIGSATLVRLISMPMVLLDLLRYLPPSLLLKSPLICF